MVVLATCSATSSSQNLPQTEATSFITNGKSLKTIVGGYEGKCDPLVFGQSVQELMI
jgi:hypothetical protein